MGVRDESRMTGGIGSCGHELCCATWLPHFEPVSIRMAKDQNLVLNPQKVSGQCGRLKCCLAYEQAQYHECRKRLPKVGRRVTTPDGEGKVLELDILGGRVKVWFEGGPLVTLPLRRCGRWRCPARQRQRQRQRPSPKRRTRSSDRSPELRCR